MASKSWGRRGMDTMVPGITKGCPDHLRVLEGTQCAGGQTKVHGDSGEPRRKRMASPGHPSPLSRDTDGNRWFAYRGARNTQFLGCHSTDATDALYRADTSRARTQEEDVLQRRGSSPGDGKPTGTVTNGGTTGRMEDSSFGKDGDAR